jgi:hypothetical protein
MANAQMGPSIVQPELGEAVPLESTGDRGSRQSVGQTSMNILSGANGGPIYV